MKQLLQILSAILLMLLQSCTSADILQRLDVAESMMHDRPDSSLVVLEAIDIGDIPSRKHRARYALLYSQAKDKNYIDETDESLINVAVDYYETKDGPKELFLSHYYKGRIQYNGNHHIQAMLSFTKAEELIEKIDDDYAIGLLYSQIGLINKAIYDNEQSLLAHYKAYDYYKSANKIYHQHFASIRIGENYIDLNEYDKARPYLIEPLQWAFEHNASSLCQECVELLSMLYEFTGDVASLKDLYESPYIELCHNHMVLNQAIAYVYACNNQEKETNELMQTAVAESYDDIYSISLLLYKDYKINKRLGNYKQALDSYEKVSYIQDTTLRGVLRNPILHAQKDYYKSQAEYRALELKYNQQTQIVIVVATIVALSLLLLFIKRKIAAKNAEISQFMEKVNNLESSMFTKSSAVDSITAQINDLFYGQFAFIDKLCNTYFDTHKTSHDKEAIYKQVKTEIEKLQRDKKYIQQLESIVNKYKNNVMQLTRDELPSLTEMELRLLCFIYAGFSAKAISVFTNDSVGNIYVKKSRIKAKIAQSDAKSKKCMLCNLN